MLLTSEPFIAALKEQQQADLAVVAIVLTMVDSPAEAVERLQDIEDTMREFTTTNTRREAGWRFYDLAKRVRDIAPALRHVCEQMDQRMKETK